MDAEYQFYSDLRVRSGHSLRPLPASSGMQGQHLVSGDHSLSACSLRCSWSAGSALGISRWGDGTQSVDSAVSLLRVLATEYGLQLNKFCSWELGVLAPPSFKWSPSRWPADSTAPLVPGLPCPLVLRTWYSSQTVGRRQVERRSSWGRNPWQAQFVEKWKATAILMSGNVYQGHGWDHRLLEVPSWFMYQVPLSDSLLE